MKCIKIIDLYIDKIKREPYNICDVDLTIIYQKNKNKSRLESYMLCIISCTVFYVHTYRINKSNKINNNEKTQDKTFTLL